MKPTLIFIDETKYWTSPPECVEKILGVYLTDTSSIFHICSMMGSYEAYFLKNKPIFYPGTSDKEKEEALRWISKHEDLSEPVAYFSEHSTFDAEIEMSYEGESPETLDDQREVMNSLIQEYREGTLTPELPF